MMGIISRDNNNDLKEYKINTFKCGIKLDLAAIDEEKKRYTNLPKDYDLCTEEKKRNFLLQNLKRIYGEIGNL